MATIKSIEEKAKAYDEAIERAKKVLLDCTPEERKVVEYVTPELKIEESEGERIRKEITEFLKKASGGFLDTTTQCKTFGKWLAWLEKRGQTFTKKDIDDAYLKGVCDAKQELEKQGEQKPWSKEEEKKQNYLIALLQNCTMNNPALRSVNEGLEDWLKSLKPQNTWRPSEAQMIVLNDIIINGHLSNANERILKGLQEQLKSL